MGKIKILNEFAQEQGSENWKEYKNAYSNEDWKVIAEDIERVVEIALQNQKEAKKAGR